MCVEKRVPVGGSPCDGRLLVAWKDSRALERLKCLDSPQSFHAVPPGRPVH